MADDNIDKALPNVEQQVTLPGEEEIVEAQETIEESLPGQPEVIEQEDLPLSYLPGNSLRVKIRIVGNIK